MLRIPDLYLYLNASCIFQHAVKKTFSRRCLSDPMSVYFNASRDKEYDRGGEEILKYDRMLINAGKFLLFETINKIMFRRRVEP